MLLEEWLRFGHRLPLLQPGSHSDAQQLSSSHLASLTTQGSILEVLHLSCRGSCADCSGRDRRDALVDLEADVLCLQEVEPLKDWQPLLEGAEMRRRSLGRASKSVSLELLEPQLFGRSGL